MRSQKRAGIWHDDDCVGQMRPMRERGGAMKVAVVGAGIAGLGAAWLAARAPGVEVTLFESEPRLGGHAHTIDVPTDAGTIGIDTGFIVYNTGNYPNLIALFDHLEVPTAPTNMSFAVSLDDGRYEYSGSGLGGMFGQWSNALDMQHLRMVRDVFRFFSDATDLADTIAQEDEGSGPSLGAWLAEKGYSRAFIDRHIIPMGAAIWSTPADQMLDFPAAAFARFFDNHGLLKARNRPAWRTVSGGSREYVKRIIKAMHHVTFRHATTIDAIIRNADGVEIKPAAEESERFDACIIATHADTALRLINDADDEEARLLSAFRYTANETYLHRDETHMPRRRNIWSSWNYCAPGSAERLAVSYWMNSLQPLNTATDWFVTLNPVRPIEDSKVHTVQTYTHPIFDADAIRAQRELWGLQGRRRTWFCGSYFAYGFHEDALQAGLAAAEDLTGQQRPWSRKDENDRLKLPKGWVPGQNPAGLKLVRAAQQASW
jgi:predicted NAD/FAD-binding protein